MSKENKVNETSDVKEVTKPYLDESGFKVLREVVLENVIKREPWTSSNDITYYTYYIADEIQIKTVDGKIRNRSIKVRFTKAGSADSGAYENLDFMYTSGKVAFRVRVVEMVIDNKKITVNQFEIIANYEIGDESIQEVIKVKPQRSSDLSNLYLYLVSKTKFKLHKVN